MPTFQSFNNIVAIKSGRAIPAARPLGLLTKMQLAQNATASDIKMLLKARFAASRKHQDAASNS
ncbi:MAG TPA: hypothetical protein VGI40_19220 [Pirellulaceae bacterium]|jgi:hypothetical protein